MKVIADAKRRVVLPKPAEAGDVFELLETGDRIVMIRLRKPAATRPPVSPSPLASALLEGIDLDEPSFAPLSDESAD